MNERITPYNITELKENEIFVFGSNSCGVHNGNAASTAMKFGSIMGQDSRMHKGKPMQYLPRIWRISRNTLMISGICETTPGMYFFSHRDRLWNIRTFTL